MIQTTELVAYLNDYLNITQFRDYCPNGLQVSGRDQVQHIVTGVSASQALLDAAIAQNADAILVHHGYFWRGEDPCVLGVKRNRLATLIENDINLLAYHLPLDAHPVVGNNTQLAKILGIEITGEFAQSDHSALGLVGCFLQPLSCEVVNDHIAKQLARDPLHVMGQSPLINTIAWCTGAAQDFIQEAIMLGVDAYLTGEVSERTVHLARESGIHFFAAGHHATERYGVQALGEHIAQRFELQHTYIEIDNPV